MSEFLDALALEDNVVNEKYYKPPEVIDFTFENLDIDYDVIKEQSYLFYVESPAQEEIGYREDLRAFFIKALPYTSKYYKKDAEYYEEFNVTDGDTMYFDPKSIQDAHTAFKIGERSYSSFSSFLSVNGQNNLIMRLLGINCPELPHYQKVPIKTDELDKYIKTISFKEAKENKGLYILDSLYQSEGKSRSDNEQIDFFIAQENYCEIVSKNFENNDQTITVLKIVYKNETNSYPYTYLKEAKDCQNMLADLLNKASDIRLVIDQQALNRKPSDFSSPYDVINWLTPDGMLTKTFSIIDGLSKRLFGYQQYKYETYNAPGQDTYGRYLGAIYVKIWVDKLQSEVWVNAAKYILYHNDQYTEAVPSYSSNPSEAYHNNFFSPTFKLSTYDKRYTELLDGFTSVTSKLIEERDQWYSAITGLDIDYIKEHTVILGDSVLTVPPMNIRSSTETDHLKIPLLRSRGSIVKSLPRSQKIIELDVYFNNNDGINGAPKEIMNNKGEFMTYYMNGLRSLIAMFKLTPFLPIENEYINNKLLVDAVTLINLNVATVPNYPKCLKATISLAEFNYSIFMPELTESQSHNSFAQSIHYPAMRWYYQRLLQKGELIKDLDFNSESYITQSYGSNTALVPMSFSNSKATFYIPNRSQLETRLEIMSDTKPILTQAQLTENMKVGAKKLNSLYTGILNLASDSNLIEGLNEYFNVSYCDSSVVNFTVSKDFNTEAEKHISKNIPLYPFIYAGQSKLEQSTDSVLRKHPIIYTNKNGLEIENYSYEDYFLFILNTKAPLEKVYKGFNENLNDFGAVDCFARTEGNALYIGAIVPLPIELTQSSYELKVIAQKVCTFLNINQDEAEKVIRYTKDGRMGVPIEIKLDIEPLNIKLNSGEKTQVYKLKNGVPNYKLNANGLGIRVIDYLYSIVDEDVDGELGDTVEKNLINEKRDTMLNEAMGLKFVKYDAGDILIEQISINYGNTFSNMTLTMIDGKAYQYCGAQDMQLQISIVTSSDLTLNALTHLPELSAEYARNYRKVLNCWPLRIDCEFTKLFGISEVIIENVQTETIPNQPGITRVTLTLTAVDRTVRRREALSKIDTESNAGSISLGNRGKLNVKTYFDLKDSLAKAELYPDLELPTVEELLEAGFEIYRDKDIDPSKTKRVFVDPDFYFIYGQALACEIFRDNFLNAFEKTTQEYDLTDGEGAYTTYIIDKESKDEKFTYKNDLAFKQREDYIALLDTSYTYKDYSREVYKALDEKSKQTLKLSESLAQIGTSFWNISDSAKLAFRESTCELMPQIITKTHKDKKQKVIEAINEFLSYSIDENGGPDKETVATPFENAKDQFTQFENLVFSTIKGLSMTSSSVNLFIQLMFVNFENIEISQLVDNDVYDATVYNKSVKDLAHILQACADANSGATYYNNQTIVVGDDADTKQNISWKAKTYMNTNQENPLPYCKVSSNTGSIYAVSMDDALDNGYSFGPFGVQTYSANQLKEFYPYTKFNQSASYFIDPYYITMQLKGDTEGIKAHKKKLMTQPGYGAIALFRQLLVFYRYYIDKEKLISLYEIARIEAFSKWKGVEENLTDVVIENNVNANQADIKKAQERIVQSFLSVLTSLTLANYETKKEAQAVASEVLRLKKDNIIYKAMTDIYSKIGEAGFYFKMPATIERQEKLYEEAKADATTPEEEIARLKKLYDICVNYKNVDVVGFAQDIMEMIKNFELENSFSQDVATQTIKQIIEDEEKMFKGRFIAMAFTLFDAPTIHPLIMEKNSDALNNLMTNAAQPEITSSNSSLRKFIYALDGRDVIDMANIGEIPSTLEAKYRNYISERINMERSKNPREYLRDSFFDMVKNDKRGRMLRAFPTYYMFFVDEGREIGLWKLHDNFYSSTAIAEIEITKSRKIAADTAHIVLSNLFNSYTQDDKDFVNDLDNPSNSVGMKYRVQDAFNALFSPRTYFIQKEKERLNAAEPLTVNLVPGTRMHIRMGYGSNAAELPIVFNGQVVEISNGEACEVVAQGDGVELLNPIQSFKDAADVQNDGENFLNKFFLNWLTVGATPKSILGNLLVADGAWMDDKIQKITNGYVKAMNPFGIYHFGDMKYDTIFKGSECIQNLFEANSRSLYEYNNKNDLNIGLETHYKTQDIPVISIDITNKTPWDIMHVCASVSPDYKTAVVPFELRSSLFMGTGRDYYAYEYAKEFGVEENSSYIYEKRKPFEQYHYYTSYSDIIANNIITDASQVKTNAIGIYNETRSFGSVKTKETGRLFVDIDIYTEYQKAMTIDTQLWAQGMPVLGNGFGLWINADTDSDTDDLIPGAAEIAWRMTASGLKNMMKDMYQGDLLVMGDPSVKPHDRMLITDVYQEMQGAAWVEAVVHSFNAQTGFTTSIYADCINEIDDRYEQQNNFLSKNACATAAAAYFTPVVLNQLLFRKNMKLINNVLMNMIIKSGLSATDFIEANRLPLTNLFGILKATDLDSLKTGALVNAIKAANSLEPPFSGAGTAFKNAAGIKNKIADATRAIFTKESSAFLNIVLNSFDDVSKKLLSIKDLKNASEVAAVLSKNAKALEDITGSNLIEKLKIASSGTDVDDLAKALIAYDNALNSEINSIFGNIFNPAFTDNIAELAKSVLTSDMDDATKATATLLNNFSNGSVVINSAESLKDFSKALKECSNVSKDTQLLANIATSMDEIKDFSRLIDTAQDVHKYAPDLKKVVQGIGALSGPAGIVASVLWIVVEMAISAVIGAYATEKLERYLQNLQVMRIYPLSKNGKVMTAGITGHKGLVVGSPTEHMQGAWTTFVTNLFGAKKPDSFVTGVIQMFFSSEKAKEIASKYRTQNNLPDVLETSYDLAELQTKFDQNYNKRIAAMAKQNPVLSLNMDRYKDVAKSSPYFKNYTATSYENSNGLSEMTRKEFLPINSYASIKRYMDDGLLVLLPELIKESIITAPFNGKSVDLPVYKEDDGKSNVPILRQEALIILDMLMGKYIEAAEITTGLLEQDKVRSNQVQLTSATILDSETYEGTGLVFRVTSQNLKALETACAKLTEEINNNKFMINHFEAGNEHIIAIAIPIAYD